MKPVGKHGKKRKQKKAERVKAFRVWVSVRHDWAPKEDDEKPRAREAYAVIKASDALAAWRQFDHFLSRDDGAWREAILPGATFVEQFRLRDKKIDRPSVKELTLIFPPE